MTGKTETKNVSFSTATGFWHSPSLSLKQLALSSSSEGKFSQMFTLSTQQDLLLEDLWCPFNYDLFQDRPTQKGQDTPSRVTFITSPGQLCLELSLQKVSTFPA